MSTKLILGLVFLMFAFVLAFIVKPWYLGLPFLCLGIIFFIQGLGEYSDKS